MLPLKYLCRTSLVSINSCGVVPIQYHGRILQPFNSHLHIRTFSIQNDLLDGVKRLEPQAAPLKERVFSLAYEPKSNPKFQFFCDIKFLGITYIYENLDKISQTSNRLNESSEK